MGQYWIAVNLDKREYIHPHRLGCGLKLWEQLANHPGTGVALIILTAAMPETRGGGDLRLESGEPEPGSYQEIAKRTIGRWAGDRIAIVGDYAERGDLPPEYNADLIYALCDTPEGVERHIDWLRKQARGSSMARFAEKAQRLENETPYKDISDDVCAVIEHELRGKYDNEEGWRTFHFSSSTT